MNLIEVLRQVEPGGSIFRKGEFRTYNHYDDIRMCDWLARDVSLQDMMADDWTIVGQSNTDALGVAAVGAEPLRLEATAIVDVLRQHFDVPARHDVLVREMWLAMQLLATPERCADFIRRAVIIPA